MKKVTKAQFDEFADNLLEIAKKQKLSVVGKYEGLSLSELNNILESVEKFQNNISVKELKNKKGNDVQMALVTTTDLDPEVFLALSIAIEAGYEVFVIDNDFVEGSENKKLIEQGAHPIEYLDGEYA